jgi:hypothetical protein
VPRSDHTGQCAVALLQARPARRVHPVLEKRRGDLDAGVEFLIAKETLRAVEFAPPKFNRYAARWINWTSGPECRRRAEILQRGFEVLQGLKGLALTPSRQSARRLCQVRPDSGH